MIAGGAIKSSASATHSANIQLSQERASKVYNSVLFLNVSRPALGNTGYNDVVGTASPRLFKAIDNKIDDGQANTGSFQSYSGYVTPSDCLDGIDGDYLLSNEDDVCMAMYVLE